MKTADEILEMVLQTIASIYKRPGMHGTDAGQLDTLLWHYHWLWLEAMEREIREYRSVISEIHGSRHSCCLGIAEHYRHHTKRGAQAGDEEVRRYVIATWKKVDKKLGMVIPPPP